VYNNPLTLDKLKEITGLDKRKSRLIINELISKYDDDSRPFKIYEIAGGYKLGTKPQYSIWVKKILEDKRKHQISKASLETLAIIAYNQPVTRLEIEKIRGVSCSGVLFNLLKHKFVKISGRKKVPGNPLLYKVTDFFLMHFGLKKINDLPKLSEIGIK
ncbi:MAG: SMC-Scp complex subunit ScpB, partial [Candidatus Atribacteria bacterium]|nr:SMC-Scp complex subunit ScpB [Candidatus Atribacteria bacterium]